MAKPREIDLLDLALTFAKHKKTFLKIVLSITVIGTIIAFIWPKSYKSEVTFIVTEGNTLKFSGGGLLNSLSNFSIGSSNINAEQALILLRSTAVQDDVIDKFELGQVYGKNIQEYIRKELNNRMVVTENREGGLGFNSIIAITFDYEDEDPQRTFDLVSYYFTLLDSTVRELNRQGISESYAMLKTRLEQNMDELSAAEDSLVSFQKKTGIIEVEEQAKAQVKALAEVKSQVVALEVQIGYAASTLGADNKNLEDLKAQKKVLEHKYEELLKGSELADTGFDVFKSARALPDLTLEYLRRYREVIVQEEIYKVLLPQFEQQKLNFNEANSGLIVIDPPVLPTYKSSPKRLFIMLGAFLFGCFAAVLVILLREWKRDAEENNPEDFRRYNELISEVKPFKKSQ